MSEELPDNDSSNLRVENSAKKQPHRAEVEPVAIPELLIGGSSSADLIGIDPGMANRHGLIAGATGTGKTVTLQILAEQFSKLGVPVLTADVKGDLAGISKAGSEHKEISRRTELLGINEFGFEANPVLLWDFDAKEGHQLRTTVSEMGPLLISRLLDLNDTQSGILEVAFALADDEGLLLLDLKDLRAILNWMADNAKELRSEYGNISGASVGAIQRRLLALQEAGGDRFFGEPALELRHIMQRDFSGRGVISVIDATSILHDPRVYSTFLLWLLSELFEQLEEVGDPEKPELVLFFDEAHLLFRDTPKALLQKLEMVVKLIRSKGVGVYFVTQNPRDIPDSVLAQLGNRVQHALRAYTPSEQKAVRAAADAFRPNPEFDSEEVITQLGVGEALVSVLDQDGKPTVVQRVTCAPPHSRIGPIEEEERAEMIKNSPIKGVYDKAIDRESAYELLKKREEERGKEEEEIYERKAKGRGYQRQGVVEAFIKSITRTIGTQLGRSIFRGVLGGITGKRR